ncbi:putative GNAT superfamily acetyltransferase [Microbacterium resistens]|uniref:GNAT superfamily acetyltransferase n=1 Tax=Microbacterium resistens TaxID=156977 RepID=A0ABU1S7Y8_9MICO|nr:GNAT family N-acetyltransferase [Microbacterium resistens]MDR6865709.1 putative GNAT superfamily acetyltransferase [Microbacterium resistens]
MTMVDQRSRDAAAHAAHAASEAGVSIRLLDTVAEFTQVVELFRSIWTSGSEQVPVNVEVLRALAKSGSYVAGAYDDDELVGACFGFFAAPERRALHSHIAGVSERMRGRSVGFALKVHQRAWALDHDLDEISWTFDPLISRNAYFNLVKLAATPVSYHRNFYGQMRDALNGGDDTDRMLVTWFVRDPRVEAVCAGRPVQTPPPASEALLSRSEADEPVRHDADGRFVRVRLPHDIERIRRDDPARATRWRIALRESLGELLDGGARVISFDRTDTYTIDRGEQP